MVSMFPFAKTYITTPVCKGPTINEVYVTVRYTGDMLFKISADGGTTWEDLTLVTATRTQYNFLTPGTELLFMAIGNPGAQIATVKYDSGRFRFPGIRIEVTGTS